MEMAARLRHLSDHDALSMLERMAAGLRIIHHVPGRVRFKLDTAGLADSRLREAAEQFAAALVDMRGLHGVCLNALARSCVVEYNVDIIPESAWPDLLAGRATPARQTLLDLLRGCAPRAGLP